MLGDCPMESDGLAYRLRFRNFIQFISHELAFGRIYYDVIKTRYENRVINSGVIELESFHQCTVCASMILGWYSYTET